MFKKRDIQIWMLLYVLFIFIVYVFVHFNTFTMISVPFKGEIHSKIESILKERVHFFLGYRKVKKLWKLDEK